MNKDDRKIRRIAIITGVQQEADAFLPDHNSVATTTPFGLMRELTIGPMAGSTNGTENQSGADKQIAIICSGIGKVHAGAAAIFLHQQFQPDLLLVIGTAGKVSNIVGDCFYLHQCLQADYGVLDGANIPNGFIHYDAGAWPIGPAQLSPFKSWPQPDGLGLPNAQIATADHFVKNIERAAYLRDHLSADLVDMETAAVAQIAALLDLPWAAIKAVTDGADGDSSEDFHANLAKAADHAAEQAARFIGLL